MGVALDWTPPAGMAQAKITQWRTFYAGIRKSYGLTPADYRLLYLAQHGRCWVCRKAKGIHPDDPKAAGTRRLGVDHNHALGPCREAVRGLLCTGSLSANTCNRMIARYDRQALLRAADYLVSPPAQLVLYLVQAERDGAARTGVSLTQLELDNLAVAALQFRLVTA